MTFTPLIHSSNSFNKHLLDNAKHSRHVVLNTKNRGMVPMGLYSGKIMFLLEQTPPLSFPIVPENVRLVDGHKRCQGRVEVKQQGQWGTVCKGSWNFAAAKVVCQQVGCGRAILTRKCCNKATQGQGPIWPRKVSCSGKEISLQDCPSEVWEKNNCTHDEDMWVECEGKLHESRD